MTDGGVAVNTYVEGFPAKTQVLLRELRSVIREAAPDAGERISYGVPTFDLQGKHLVHFAGYAGHIGFYPTPSAVAAFEEELAEYKHAKGSVQFPLDGPMPADLIRRMVAFRVREVTDQE